MQPPKKKFLVTIELDLEKVKDIEWALKQATQAILNGNQEFSTQIGDSKFTLKCQFEPETDYSEKKINDKWYRVYPSSMNKQPRQ